MGLTRPRAYQIYDIDYKQSVRALSTSNVTLTGGAPSQVDGINLSANDRILVIGQSNAVQNGIYYVTALGTGSNGTWARTTDANQTGEMEAGMIIMVTEGAVYADTSWKLITNDPIVLGTSELVFELNTGVAFGNIVANGTPVTSNSASGTFTLAAGNNVSITGNNTSKTITISASGGGGSGTAIVNGTSNVDIASANANVTVSVAGTPNIAVFSANGLAVTGTVTGNGISTTTVSNTAPANPEQGDIWIDSDTGIQYIYFTASGNSQWAEMESETSISISSLDYGNANVLAYLTTGVAGNILPSANVTYDLGSTANRWNDIWLANSTIYLGEANISASGTAVVLPAGTTIGGSPAEMPKIANVQITNSSWTVLDDTAISTDGGYFIVNGSGFQSGATVTVDGTNASSVTFISSNLLRCQIGAKAAASYTVYVINPDGGTALRPSGLTYSGLPTWVTASQLANATANTAFTYTLSATGAVSYALAPGNTVPTGSTLAANGVFSGNVAVANNTSYSFTVTATDAEQQDANRTFSLNVNSILAPTSVEYLVVAGGGGGGAHGGAAGGGGGAGGFRTGNLAVSSGVSYTVTVGSGGAGAVYSGTGGSKGNDSVFSTITSAGGGLGAASGTSGNFGTSGGSGGGSCDNGGNLGGAGNTPSTSPSQGSDGGKGYGSGAHGGGGGGGASQTGADGSGTAGGKGGNGTASSISGASVTYAGGGGGGARATYDPGSGGTGGGGQGSASSDGQDGTSNLGGGGGGTGKQAASTGGAGGSGVVIIRYADTFSAASATTGSPEITVTGGYRIYKWTGSGSITF